MNGCTNPKAVNYNPSATVNDQSCIYLEKVGSVCYAFQDIAANQLQDQSYTLSYTFAEGGGWVFFHDYIPDFYFATKTQLYSLKGKSIYKHNQGPNGVFYDTPKSFFIDAVFNSNSEMILESVNWLTEVLNNDQSVEFSTLSHITIWNNQQCTGRIPLTQVFDDLQYTVRKTQALWSFDAFRDMVATYGTKFLQDLFHNFAVDESAINTDKPWFDQDLLHDNFFIIRFEFDNSINKQIILHGADIKASKSYR